MGSHDAELFYKETNSKRTINNILDHDYKLGIIRYAENYDKYFKDGDCERNPLTEFNSNNTELLGVDGVKDKLLSLQYIRDEIVSWKESK